MKLLVRNLSRSTTEQEIRILFSNHGSVTDCSLVLDQETGKSKGFAFVEMPNGRIKTNSHTNGDIYAPIFCNLFPRFDHSCWFPAGSAR